MRVFRIVKKTEGAVLGIDQRARLVMSREETGNVFLATADMSLGVIFEKGKVLTNINIIEKDGKFVLSDQVTEKIYTSKPLGDKPSALFHAARDIAREWEYFELDSIDHRPVLEFAQAFLNQEIKEKTKTLQLPVNLCWFRKKNGGTNFGDELNPYLVSYLSGRQIKRVDFAETDLLGAGSILAWPPKREKLYRVWGSGTLAPQDLDTRKFDVSALRGPLTKSLLDIPNAVPYGDPGIISNRIWKGSSKKKYKWGIIPHFTQEKHEWVNNLLKNTPDSILIKTGNRDLSEIMQQISSCEAIASTSLHGLIVADSYEIPNAWLWVKNVNRGGQWKFFDYFAGVNRRYVDNIDPREIRSLNDIELKLSNYRYFNQLGLIKDSIISSFPI